VNLTLEIKGKRADSYHELESLVLFADFGDTLTCSPNDRFDLEIDGAFAATIDPGPNLIEKAALAYARAFGRQAGAKFHLTKRLPVSAGLGGGSADAAAALRLLRAMNEHPEDLSSLIPMAAEIGADIPCCLFSKAAVMTGIGERLHPLPPVPVVAAILVNPMQPLATRDVFQALKAGPLLESASPASPPLLSHFDDVVAYASGRRNDLEAPARECLPVISEVLSALSRSNGARLARLSGSGPTCFALFQSFQEAQDAAERIAAERSDWWVQPVTLS
jgi:4-diphosphocytidyl-2-C-methyl-D-erythritol kinase